MTIALHRVTEALVERTRAAERQVETMLLRKFTDISIQAIGSSLWSGSLSKGDIDILVRVPADHFRRLVASLEDTTTTAQSENWSDSFASFKADRPHPFGIQVVTQDSIDDTQFSSHHRAMQSRDFRVLYDCAKEHAAPLGALGYWKTKDVFWRTLELSGPAWKSAKSPVLKILREHEWLDLLEQHTSLGAPIDIKDGFVHLSTPDQVAETVAKHFGNTSDLWLLTLDADSLGTQLKWEPSRGGALFPHLYDTLKLADVCLVRPWR